jgi:hypothetical protein
MTRSSVRTDWSRSRGEFRLEREMMWNLFLIIIDGEMLRRVRKNREAS